MQAPRYAEIRLTSSGDIVAPELFLWPDGSGQPERFEGEPTEWDQYSKDLEEGARGALKQSGGDRTGVKTFGEFLKRALIPSRIEGPLGQFVDGIAGDSHLVLGIRLAPTPNPLLSSVPFELLRFRGTYWVCHDDRSLVRIVDPLGASRRPDAQGRLRVQVVEGPRKVVGAQQLGESKVRDQLRKALGGSATQFLERAVAPTIDELEAILQKQSGTGPVDLLVYEGHGHPGALTLGGDLGAERAPAEALANVLAHKVRAVVLLSCEAGSPSFDSGVAESLARVGLPTVAWQTTLTQLNAQGFVAELARALADGKTLVEGVTQARLTLNRDSGDVVDRCRLTVWTPDWRALQLRAPELPLAPRLVSPPAEGCGQAPADEAYSMAVLTAAGLQLVPNTALTAAATPAVVAADARWVAAIDGTSLHVAKVDRGEATLQPWPPKDVATLVGDGAELLAVGPFGSTGVTLVVVDGASTVLLRLAAPTSDPNIEPLGGACTAAAVVRGQPWLVRAGQLELPEGVAWTPPGGGVLDLDVAGSLGEEMVAVVLSNGPSSDEMDGQLAKVEAIIGAHSPRPERVMGPHPFTHAVPRVRLHRDLSRRRISRMMISGSARPIDWSEGGVR